MQRREHQRGTHVLMFGLSRDEWLDQKTMVKGGLQSMHMGWSFTSGAELTAEGAVKHIKEREDLELVMFYPDSMKRPRAEMLYVAIEIAKALSEHPHKPWVHIMGEEETSYLKPVFDVAGIRVECGLPAYVIFERWNSQVPEEKVA